jgi:hypothetical protein
MNSRRSALLVTVAAAAAFGPTPQPTYLATILPDDRVSMSDGSGLLPLLTRREPWQHSQVARRD